MIVRWARVASSQEPTNTSNIPRESGRGRRPIRSGSLGIEIEQEDLQAGLAHGRSQVTEVVVLPAPPLWLMTASVRTPPPVRYARELLARALARPILRTKGDRSDVLLGSGRMRCSQPTAPRPQTVAARTSSRNGASGVALQDEPDEVAHDGLHLALHGSRQAQPGERFGVHALVGLEELQRLQRTAAPRGRRPARARRAPRRAGAPSGTCSSASSIRSHSTQRSTSGRGPARRPGASRTSARPGRGHAGIEEFVGPLGAACRAARTRALLEERSASSARYHAVAADSSESRMPARRGPR